MTFEQAAEIIVLLQGISLAVVAIVQVGALTLGVLLFIAVQSAFKL